MPFARPSLADLIARAAADIEAGLPGADARLRRSNLAVLGRMHAADGAAVRGLRRPVLHRAQHRVDGVQ